MRRGGRAAARGRPRPGRRPAARACGRRADAERRCWPIIQRHGCARRNSRASAWHAGLAEHERRAQERVSCQQQDPAAGAPGALQQLFVDGCSGRLGGRRRCGRSWCALSVSLAGSVLYKAMHHAAAAPARCSCHNCCTIPARAFCFSSSAPTIWGHAPRKCLAVTQRKHGHLGLSISRLSRGRRRR